MRILGFSACTQVFSSLLDLGVQRASKGRLPVLEKPCGNVGLKQCSQPHPHLLVLYSEVKVTWAVLYGVRLMRRERRMNLLLLRREISINVIYNLGAH